MEPNTLRLQPNTWETLSEEATEYGFANRSEYIRHILDNREAITENTQSNTQENTTDYARAERVDELEARLEALEEEGAVSDSPERRESESSPEPMEDLAHNGRREQRASLGTGSRGEGDDGLDEALRAVDGLEWGSETRGDPEDYRETLRTVLREIAAADDGLKKREIQERVFPEYSVGFDKDRWWKNLVWKRLKELRDDHGVVHTEGGGKYTTWHLGPEESDVYDPTQEFE